MSVKLREKTLADGRISLYLDIYHDRQRSYEFLNLYLEKNNPNNRATRQLAEKIRSRRELDVDTEAHGFAPKQRRKENFLAYFTKLADTHEDRTKTNWHTVKRHLEKYGGENVPFMQVTPRWLNGFKEYLGGVVSSNTAYNYFAIIKTAVRQAVRERYLMHNPCEEVERIEKEERLIVYLTPEELSRLMVKPCDHDDVKRAFLFACYTGLRISDMKRLRWQDVRDMRLAIKQKKTKNPVYLELHAEAIKLLGEHGEPEECVFALPSLPVILKYLKRWVERAEIPKHVTTHIARHTFATMLLTAGVDLYTVSKLLGHSSIRNTTIYAHVVDSKMRTAINLLPSISEVQTTSDS